jgi:hypothetical protein
MTSLIRQPLQGRPKPSEKRSGVLPERQQLRYITCGGCNIALSFPYGPDDDDFDHLITCLVCKHVNEPPASTLRLCLQD